MIHVYTGNGKGKTSAALGVAFRAAGSGWNTCIIQFIKGDWKSGELEAAKNFPSIDIIPAGKGFYKILNDNQSEEDHRRAALEAIKTIETRIQSGKYSLIILDEVNVAVSLGLIPTEIIRKIIKNSPQGIHFVLTGRNAPPEFIEIADLVTEMKEIKHPFNEGQTAQKGLDF
jgi:cob(I)alamin adenosyltransferase